MNWSGNMPVERDSLMILVIVGSRADLQSFKREVGMGSSSHEVAGEFDIILEISSVVAGWKNEKFGGFVGGGKWGEIEVGLEVMWFRSFVILSEKNVAKDWESEVMEVGRDEEGFLCKRLFIVFHNFLGLSRLEEMSEAL